MSDLLEEARRRYAEELCFTARLVMNLAVLTFFLLPGLVVSGK
jgi:hypothetical protein